MLKSYTIKAIDGKDTTVEFVGDEGTTVTQKISGLSVDAKAKLEEELAAYFDAYVAGKALEVVVVDDAIKLNTKVTL